MDVQLNGSVSRRSPSIWRRIAMVVLVIPALLMMAGAAPAMADDESDRVGFDPNLVRSPLRSGLLSAQATSAALTVANMLTNTPESLVATLVGNSSIPVSNIKYTGAQVAAGTFSGGDGIIGFGSGIILSTGNIKNVIGPNRYDNVTTANGTAGDPSLNFAGYLTRDAAALEFDFIPSSSTITFQYVFASDEYNEYANALYNDRFAFFVNGVNKALVPGTNTPVSINTINGGNPLGTNPQNPQYYINNARPGATLNTEMDGMTVVLTLQSSVNKGQLNHMKLVIADVNDSKFDSNVFIKAGTFADQVLPPMTAATTLPSANGAGWNNTDVTVSMHATPQSEGDTVKEIHYQIGSDPEVIVSGANASFPVTTEGTVTVTYYAVGTQGGAETPKTLTVKVDKTIPSISGAPYREPNANGWYNDDVPISFSCDDTLSGIAFCSLPTLSTEGINQSIIGQAKDNADNVNTFTVTGLNLDKTPPVIAGAPDRPANADGWYNAPVTIYFTCDDSLSGIDSCTGPTTLEGEGTNQGADGTATDKAGNSTSASVAGINIDMVPPVTTATAPAGWQTSDATVTFAATDNGSGVKYTYYTVDGGAAQTGTSLTLTAEGSHTIQYWSVDKAGNTEPAQTATVQIDKTAPTITHAQTPAPNADGWNNSNVTITFTCDDANGIATCSDPVTLTADGQGQVVTGTATDVAGNTATDTATVNLDKTAPTITGAPDRAANADGWYNAPVTVAFTCSDSLSGVVACPADVTLATGGEHQNATGTIADKAGNSATTTVSGINIDQTAPTTTAAAPTHGQNGAVIVALTATDNLSGVKTTYYKVDGGEPQTGTTAVISTGGAHTLDYWSVDKAGNAEQPQTLTFQLDTTAPTITHTLTPAPNAEGWNNSPVTVHFDCQDADLAFCTGDVYVTAEGAGQVVTGTATDTAGNTSTDSVTLNIDMTPPTIAGTRDHQPNADGWYNAPVTVTFACSDSLSGVAACPSVVTLAGEGENQSATGNVFDQAGNTASAVTAGINIDLTPPATSAAAPAGWQTTDVTVTLVATDDLSGVNATYFTIDGGAPQTGTSLTLTTEGAHTIQYWSVDLAGNAEQAKTVSVQLDKAAPTISHSLTPAPNAAGWNNTDVTVAFTCTDTNGIDNCSGPTTLTAEGAGQAVTGTATDTAGKTATDTVTVNIDKTAPTIAGAPDRAPNADGWYNAPVTVTFTCADALSGIVACPAAATLGTEGKEQRATGTVADKAGNTSSATVGGINIDLAPPQTASDAPTGWQNHDVTVTFSASDLLSGVKATYYSIDNGPAQTGSIATVSVDGTHTITFWSVDAAGNAEEPQTVTVQIDKSAPTIAHTQTPAPNAGGWNNTDVDLTFTCSDGNELADCTGPVKVTTEGAGQAVTGTATDVAGNTATDTVTLNIDKTAPSITAATNHEANADGWYNAPVTLTFTCSDGLSGIAVCPEAVSLPNEGAAQHASGVATDKAGNQTEASINGINIDMTPPVTATAAPAGWQNSPVTVTFAATDNLSGVKETYYSIDGGDTQTGASAVVVAEGQHTIRFQSLDLAGNAEPMQEVTVWIDYTAPSITYTQAPAPNDNGWNNGAVTVHFECQDTNGVAACTGDVVVTTEGAGQIVTGTATDIAGNTTTMPVPVYIDMTGPSITAERDHEPNADGWYNDPVTVTFTCDDGLSGIWLCPDAVTLTDEGQNQSVDGAATDYAGNSSSTTLSGINIDLTAPVTTATAPTGWQSSDVTVTFTATDNHSGVKTTYYTVDGGVPQTGSSLTLSTEGTHTVRFWSVDKAGNAEPAQTVTIQIDKAAPTIAYSRQPAPNVMGWNNTDVAVTFTCDDGNGIAACTGDTTLTTEGAGQVVTGTAEDTAGNTTTKTVTVNIDKTAPTITAAKDREPNADGWYNAPVTVTFTCSDRLSGIAECAAPVELTAEGADLSVTGAATDNAGNSSMATVTGINIDLTAPVTTVTAPAGWQSSDVTVTFVATDNRSGVKDTYFTIDGGDRQTGTSAAVTTEGTHTVTFWSVDKAGNAEQAKTITVQIDKTAPTITGAPDRAANADGWYNAPVTVSFTCSDAQSGIATCSDPVKLTAEGKEQSASGTATDKAGNSSSTTVSGINIDLTAPVTTATAPAGWQKSPVNVTFAATDNLSGVKATYYTVDGGAPQTGSNLTLTAEGTHTIQYWSVDKAGNAEQAKSVTVQIDNAAPTITHTQTPPPNAYGWNNTAVTVDFTCQDSNGIATCTGDATVTTEGAGQVVTGTATDTVGNTTTQQVTLNIDLTAPAITAAKDREPNAAGWYNAPVTVTFTCTDGLSGIATCPGPVTLAAEGKNQSGSGTATDKAGNTASALVDGINIDLTAPVTTATAPAGWQKGDVTVTFAATDSLSGVKATFYTVDGGASQTGSSLSLTAEGTHTIQYWSLDKAGNVEQAKSVTVQIDNSAPTITHTQTPAPNSYGWNNTDVAVTFTCSDTNGIASCTGSTTVSTEGQGQVVTGTATDLAGNTRTDSATLNIDKTAPTITYAGYKDTYFMNEMVNITCSASDSLSGVASSTCQPISVPAYTLGLGAHTYTAAATDKAGNVGTGTVTFTVVQSSVDGTCALIDQLVPQHGVANSLCVKIRNSMAAKERGSYGAAFNLLEAFKQEVLAQDERHIVPGGRDILLQLANTLEAALPPDDRDKRNN